MICGSWCSKSSLAKAAGAEVAAQQTGEKWHAAVARSTFVSQNAQNTSGSEPFLKLRSRNIARRCGAKHICKSNVEKTSVRNFGSSDVKKSHADVARSTFVSQNAQNTSGSEPFLKLRSRNMARRCGAKHVENAQKASVRDQFWKFRCQKITRRCGAKHIFKSKCAKHHTLGPLFEDQMTN